MATSYVRNCYVKMRSDQEGAMFSDSGDGEVLVALDGYAIVPIEDYRAGRTMIQRITGCVVSLIAGVVRRMGKGRIEN